MGLSVKSEIMISDCGEIKLVKKKTLNGRINKTYDKVKDRLVNLPIARTVCFRGEKAFTILPYYILLFKDDIDAVIMDQMKKNPTPFSPPYEKDMVVTEK